jgi:flagellar basal-body rod protein FlgB
MLSEGWRWPLPTFRFCPCSARAWIGGAGAKQRVLAENVANSDTPKFRARDLAPLQFDNATGSSSGALTPVSLSRTADSHIEGVGLSQSPYRNSNSRTFEVRPAGNAVNLEEEMMKVASNQMDFQAATALYTRSLNLIKTALGKR